MIERIFPIRLLHPSFKNIRPLIGIKHRHDINRFFNQNMKNQKGNFFEWISSDSIKKSNLKSLRSVEYRFFGMLQLTQKILPQSFTDIFVVLERYSNIFLGLIGVAD